MNKQEKTEHFNNIVIPRILETQNASTVATESGYNRRVLVSRLANLGYSKLWRMNDADHSTEDMNDMIDMLFETQNASIVANHLNKDYADTHKLLNSLGIKRTWGLVSDDEISHALNACNNDIKCAAKFLKVTVTHIKKRTL
jgi:hypothetical protein